MNTLAPSACFGTVMHARRGAVPNRFVYPLAFLRVPLSRLAELSVPLLGIDRAQVFSIRASDHGACDGSPLLPWIRGVLAHHKLDGCTAGEVVLQTMPRVFGYAFNPVSFWFCHDRDGKLTVVLAEVRNTFGERHNYLFHRADCGPIDIDDELRARKVFHVSPFFPVRGEYRLRVTERGGASSVSIDYWCEGALRLHTCVSGRLEPLDAAALRKWLWRFPFMTLAVVLRIHWQALRLWVRRAHFFRKPEPPLEETTR